MTIEVWLGFGEKECESLAVEGLRSSVRSVWVPYVRDREVRRVRPYLRADVDLTFLTTARRSGA